MTATIGDLADALGRPPSRSWLNLGMVVAGGVSLATLPAAQLDRYVERIMLTGTTDLAYPNIFVSPFVDPNNLPLSAADFQHDTGPTDGLHSVEYEQPLLIPAGSQLNIAALNLDFARCQIATPSRSNPQ